MRKILIAAAATGLAVILLIASAMAAMRLAPMLLHVSHWMTFAVPLIVVVAGLPAIVSRIRKHGFFSVDL